MGSAASAYDRPVPQTVIVSGRTTRSACWRAASSMNGANKRQFSAAVFLPEGRKCTAARRTLRGGGAFVSVKETSLHSTCAREAQRKCSSTIAREAFEGARYVSATSVHPAGPVSRSTGYSGSATG